MEDTNVVFLLKKQGVHIYLKLFLNPLYTGKLFHCYMLDESIILSFRCVRYILLLYTIFDGKSC